MNAGSICMSPAKEPKPWGGRIIDRITIFASLRFISVWRGVLTPPPDLKFDARMNFIDVDFWGANGGNGTFNQCF
jgi:hypothetical protein